MSRDGVRGDAELLEQCRQTVRRIRRHGADAGEIYGTQTRSLSSTVEKHDLQISRSQTETSFGIRAWIGQRVGFASTNDPDRLDEACADAVTLAKASPEDDYNNLPQPKEVLPIEGIYDAQGATFSMERSVAEAIRMIETATSVDRRVILGDAAFSADVYARAIASSEGVELSERGTLFSYYALATAVEGEKISSFDFQFGASRTAQGIDVSPVVRRACENALGSLGAGTGESFVGSVLLTPNAVQELLVPLILFQTNAKNAVRGMSRWGDCLGRFLAAGELSIVDRGRLHGGVGTAAFDREGSPHEDCAIMSKGRLTSLLHNTYTSAAMAAVNTGHAGGSSRSVPGVGPTNFEILPGTVKREDLIGETRRGVLVTRYSGTVDPVSGDFSGVAKGAYLIRRGKLERPIKGTLISGNLFDALRRISGISREREPLFNLILPTIRIEQVSITAGT
ncbi:TldD/PmbA family protein [Candidatus Bipolaricaulota bacterium]|nr:TldD/PmbA family protein [Candidatus Bipolaricaulota bacterium]